MKITSIHDIRKISLQYNCEDPDKLSEKGFVKAHFDIEKWEVKPNDTFKVVDLSFKMFIASKELTEGFNEDEVEANIKITYRMLYTSDEKDVEVEDREIIRELEPYIRKEIMDFYSSTGLPKIALPYGLWKNAKSN